MRVRLVNFAKGKWYPAGAARLMRSLTDVGFAHETRFYTDESELGVPSHDEAPYLFKLGALEIAQREGVDIVIWADAAIRAIAPLDRMIQHIAAHDYSFMSSCGVGEQHMCGVWTNDRMLEHFKLSRDEAMGWEQHSACCFGLRLGSPAVQQLLREWRDAAPCFPGAWDNSRRTESNDPRCRGHRHDQAALSIIAHRLGMSCYPRDLGFVAYEALAVQPYHPDVCLVSRGM